MTRGRPDRRRRSGGRRPQPGRDRGHERGQDRRTGLGGDRIEGRRAVLAALVARRRRVREIWMAGELDPSPLLESIRSEADRAGVPVSIVTGDDVDQRARTDAPQGIVARADPLPEADIDELLAAPDAFLVALDGVTDPGNLGAVLRTAEGAGATGVVLPKRRSAHVTPAACKAAAGAVEYLPLGLVSGIPTLLERASRAGVWVVGLDGDGDLDVFGLELADQPLVVVFGAEGRGLARLTRDRCDILCRIPMRGRIESLNVSAAAAVACYEIARRRSILA